jgi:hypothetical protein
MITQSGRVVSIVFKATRACAPSPLKSSEDRIIISQTLIKRKNENQYTVQGKKLLCVTV